MTDKEESVKKRRVRCDSAETEMSDGFRDQDLVDSNYEDNSNTNDVVIPPKKKKRIPNSLNTKKSKYQKKYKSNLAKIDWDKADLETADFFFPRPIEHEIQEEAEIGELFDIPKEEIDDSKDSISTSEKEKDNDDSDWITDNEEDEEAVNDKEEQDGFMNLLSAINLRGVSLALNNARFPAMEQTALYSTGYLVKEYIKHLSENLSENEQEIEQVIKNTIEQHKPKMTFEDMDKS
ncbi:hypothetical protein G6F70_007107 [Rhizopus microsporus]|uniref:Uncharacterized protein n=1 Tax=Rhizopus microsporus TaxID=58291 RepID=A0A0A1PAB6_RHIZD|nr:hypothetical protein G6F71_007043 [Rhizopus microsporus]KAG1196847.1 hypothetical protein G6F70_007107 [Rhizopus microsporus]KAG1209880.1 hypothetical protein G6F69_005961 [Rhizopus microsporus]KAG1230059.1 hypothetical protein G6F67_006718 [Rhizopus microsporus]KAG1262165.1 hypothetical protein G6F68_006146 [Rhizopus microsporus]